MKTAPVILSVQNLHICFTGSHRKPAVDNISFMLRAGRTLAVVGESGSGKSLTALALTGLLPPQAVLSGSIRITDPGNRYWQLNTLSEQQWREVRGKKTGIVFQEPMSALNPVMKVGQQVSEAILAHQHVTKKLARKMTMDWFSKVQLPFPEQLYERYPHQLSGGQKQRVMIAMAMCHHPLLLIADEPTTALDVTVQQEILWLMRRLQQQYGMAMLFITHDLSLAAGMADEVLVLYHGRMMEYGPAATVLQYPEQAYTRALIACRPSLAGKNKPLPVVADFLSEHKPDKPVVLHEPAIYATADKTPLLVVSNLCVLFAGKKGWTGKRHEGVAAVDNVSFELQRGEVLGLVGESGCGKSTLSKSLTGLLPVSGGEVSFDGSIVSRHSSRAWIPVRKQVQMIFQDPYGSLNPRMQIGDMLMEPMKVHGLVSGYSALRKEAARLLDMVQLPVDACNRYPHQFSGGQRQRVAIARALAVRPRLLICDESVSALDVSVQAQILNLLRELQVEFGLSYLFISHDLSVVHYISDRIMVMQAGKIVETGKANEILTCPKHPYTQKLIAAIPGGLGN